MSHPRFSLAQDAHVFDLPDAGDLVICGAVAGVDLGDLPTDRILVVSDKKTDHTACAAAGLRTAVDMPDRATAILVILPRSKALAKGLIARALAISDGPVIVDGAKTDGADSILKDCRGRGTVDQVIAKAHGKLFALRGAASDFADWALPETPQDASDGFVTLPGVFSADGIDPASRLLADSLPKSIGKRVADLGAGWGYLSARLLERADLTALHLVEDDHSALTCARLNLTDPRAQFHWADATQWRPDAALDGIVMNPPFHSGRAADPGLGQAFIASAAACLAPHGRLWLVANRHLPYETVLGQTFRDVQEIAGDKRFKVLAAHRPTRHKR